MRTISLGLFLVLLAPLAAMAQSDNSKVEVFGGYAYFRANPSAFDEIYEWNNMHGWNASVTGYLTSWLGVEGDFGGYYGSPSVYGYDIPLVDVSYYTFMAGPKLAYRKGAVTPFGHFLIGGARGSFKVGVGSWGTTLSDDTALATAVGGGIDIKLNKRVSIRAIQADYLMTRFRPISDFPFSGVDERQNNFRLSSGIVVRF